MMNILMSRNELAGEPVDLEINKKADDCHNIDTDVTPEKIKT